MALVAALGASAAAVLALAGRGGEPEFRGSEPPSAVQLAPFALRDQRGVRVSSADLSGKAVAVTFLDTECTEACPIIAAQVSQAIRALGEKRAEVEALAITVDPTGDTPRRIEGFLSRYRATETLRYLDGTVGELRPVWRGFKVASSLDSGDSNLHSAPVRVYDRNGRWRSTLHAGVDLTPANLTHDLRAALSSS